MRIAIMITVAVFISAKASAQNWAEWFKQKKTQKKYLVEQIAALKIYTEYLQQGYQIAKGGLTLIGDLKEGEFSLHKNYFQSLKTVNPNVRGYVRVAEMLAMNYALVESVQKLRSALKQDRLLTTEERGYLDRVLGRLLDGCALCLDELLAVVTDGQMEMKDDERIRRIDQLHGDMIAQREFYARFRQQAVSLIANRKQTAGEVNLSRELYQIK